MRKIIAEIIGIFTIPIADGTAGQVLETDGNGNLSFVTPSGGIDLNAANEFGGSFSLDPTVAAGAGSGSIGVTRSIADVKAWRLRASSTNETTYAELGQWEGATPSGTNVSLALAFDNSFYSNSTYRNFSIMGTNDGTVNNNPTAGLTFETGNKTAGSGNSGSIKIQTGTSAGGTRGTVDLNGSSVRVMDEKPVRFFDSGSASYVGIKSPTTLSGNYTITMPTGGGAAGDTLVNDGSQNLSWSQPAKLSVRLDTNQSIPDSTITTVIFDTVVTNSGFTYNAGTGVATCLTAGTISITASARTFGGASGGRIIMIAKNGVQIKESGFTTSTAYDLTLENNFGVLAVAANDTIEIQFYQDSGSATTIAAALGFCNTTFFCISYI